MFGGKKSLRDCKALDVINAKKAGINIDEALKGSTKEKCVVLYEDDKVQYLQWISPSMRDTDDYSVLRREKDKNDRIVFVGKTVGPYCYYDAKVFYVLPHTIPLHDDKCMIMLDCKTGETKNIPFLEDEMVLGLKTKQCWDKIVKISAADQRINIFVRRRKNDEPELAEVPYNEDLAYCIHVICKDGQFTKVPVTAESIIARGPWPKPQITLPSPPYTEAEMDMFYHQYGKELVAETIEIMELYYW